MGKTLTFRRGVHPREAAGGKHETGAKPIENAAAPSMVAVPLLQHAGAPAKPMVKPGTPVLMGQKIAAADGYVSAAVHSPVSGIVKSIQTRIAAGGRRVDAVIIENNALDEWDTSLLPVRDPDDPAQLLAAIREAGVVGMGGATFPTHVKLSPPSGKAHRHADSQRRGVRTVPERGSQGDARRNRGRGGRAAHRRENHGREAALHRRGGEQARRHRGVAPRWGGDAEVCVLRVKYPQGGEKQLIQTLTGRRVPSGGLPMDVGCVVLNVSTAAAISRAVREGRPVIDRVVTVAGAVREPKNLRVRIGVDIDSVIEQCGGADAQVNKIVLGGPMMGQCAYNPNTPVTKGVSGVLLACGSRERTAACQLRALRRLRERLPHRADAAYAVRFRTQGLLRAGARRAAPVGLHRVRLVRLPVPVAVAIGATDSRGKERASARLKSIR